MQNIRYALRQLARSPGYAAVALGTLALGIGANTAIFSLVEAALLRGLPFADPSRLVALWERNPRSGNPRNFIANPNFVRWHERAQSFKSMAGYAGSPSHHRRAPTTPSARARASSPPASSRPSASPPCSAAGCPPRTARRARRRSAC